MKVLIDTHIALWSLYDCDMLKSSSSKVLASPVNEVFVSLASAWEVEIKHSIGKLDVPSDVFISDCKEMGYKILPINEKHVLEFGRLEKPATGHKDPFDRMLLAQSVSEGVFFLTGDSKILDYGLANIIR